MQLTDNFSLEELTRSQLATRSGIDNSVPKLKMGNIRRLADFLQELRNNLTEKLGKDTPVNVSSGYRCYILNVLVGGSERSGHLSALCADISVPGMSPLELALFIESTMGGKYDQLIHEFGEWVHVGLSEEGEALRGQNITAMLEPVKGGGTKVVYLPGLLRVVK